MKKVIHYGLEGSDMVPIKCNAIKISYTIMTITGPVSKEPANAQAYIIHDHNPKPKENIKRRGSIYNRHSRYRQMAIQRFEQRQ